MIVYCFGHVFSAVFCADVADARVVPGSCIKSASHKTNILTQIALTEMAKVLGCGGDALRLGSTMLERRKILKTSDQGMNCSRS